MQVVRGTFGGTVVTMCLYGDVTPARAEVEQRIATHRAEQLGYMPVKRRNVVSRAEEQVFRSFAGRHGDDVDGVDWV